MYTHTHSYFYEYKGPPPLIWALKEGQSVVEQHTTTWLLHREIHTQTPYLGIAKLPDVFIAHLKMMTSFTVSSWALHHVDHTGIILPSQTLTMKTNSPSSWCHINHSDISNKNKSFIIMSFINPSFISMANYWVGRRRNKVEIERGHALGRANMTFFIKHMYLCTNCILWCATQWRQLSTTLSTLTEKKCKLRLENVLPFTVFLLMLWYRPPDQKKHLRYFSLM